MVVANFLMGPVAQARAQDPKNLGSFSVLDVDRLPMPDRKRFDDLSADPALPTNQQLGKPLPEPHPSWMTRITASWEQLIVE
jgi:putative thiamine transport system substrate-binding protein